MLEHSFLMIFPEMRDQLGVAVRAEPMSPGFEPGFDLGVVEEFTIVNDDDGAVLVADRLPSVLQADDAEAPIRQPDAGLFEIAVFIGSAVNDGVRHALQDAGWNGTTVGKIDEACDTTHAMHSKNEARGPGLRQRATMLCRRNTAQTW